MNQRKYNEMKAQKDRKILKLQCSFEETEWEVEEVTEKLEKLVGWTEDVLDENQSKYAQK